MKTKNLCIFFMFLLIINLSCSKEFATDKPENVLKKLSQTDKAVEKNKYYSNYSAQQSVWVVSDNNSIGSIDDEDKDTESMFIGNVIDNAVNNKKLIKYI